MSQFSGINNLSIQNTVQEKKQVVSEETFRENNWHTKQIRNFCIIAHIDHGKTTLTDCLLKTTHSVAERDFQERLMDSNPIEKERGITIKLAPVSIIYNHFGEKYLLNLIDTPGHVDFGYEVSRSLAACEGAILVVDASQGIQAQTLSTYERARQLGLKIIPVINKIDLPSADVEATLVQLMDLCQVEEKDVILVSAKNNIGIDHLLEAIIERIPSPESTISQTRALLVTSLFDQHRGAIAVVRVVDGQLPDKTKLQFVSSGVAFQPIELGIFKPNYEKTNLLQTGQVGYLATGLKDVRGLQIGDTLTLASQIESAKPLAGYREPKPAVYMELYPVESGDFPLLQDAMSKLVLRDAALQYSGVYSQALGSGLRVGFLGILHGEIVLERLSREFNLEILATSPSVSYLIQLRNGETITVYSSAQWPDPAQILNIQEPLVSVKLYTASEYLGAVLSLIQQRRGVVNQTLNVGVQLVLEITMPLSELITDFQDVLKSATSGYGSFEYEESGYALVDAVKVSILLNGELIDSLSFICVRESAQIKARAVTKKLKDVLPRQMFEVPIQAAIGGNIIARETLKAFRKDVTAKLYGGDATRRKKLLAKQAKGKKRMRQFGKVEIDHNTFLELLRT